MFDSQEPFDADDCPRVSLRVLQKNHTRRHLMSVARELFRDRGVEATTIGDISQKAGTCRATFYMHFPSKESVLQELWEDLWRDICALHTELASRRDWSHPVLNAWLSTVSGVWREHAHILALAMYSPMAGLYDTLGERLKTEAEKLAVAPHWMSFTPDEARRRSHLLLLQLHQAMAALHFRGWCVDAEALVESLTDIWLQAATGLPDVDFAQAS